MSTHYETLGITRQASKDEVRSAYILLAKTIHPDVIAQGCLGTDRFVAIHNAYKTLNNPLLRKQYNDWLDDMFVLCKVCKGRGVTVKQVTLKERMTRPCLTCKGSGVLEHK